MHHHHHHMTFFIAMLPNESTAKRELAQKHASIVHVGSSKEEKHSSQPFLCGITDPADVTSHAWQQLPRLN
jgi:hypothetical protein